MRGLFFKKASLTLFSVMESLPVNDVKMMD
jgi:hypothetical protein